MSLSKEIEECANYHLGIKVENVEYTYRPNILTENILRKAADTIEAKDSQISEMQQAFTSLKLCRTTYGGWDSKASTAEIKAAYDVFAKHKGDSK